MINKLLEPTCSEFLQLHYESTSFTAGLCLSKLSLETLKEKRSDFLHSRECNHFNSLKYLKRQYSYLLGRYCAKKVLFSLYNLCPTEIFIDNGVFQQPIIYSPTQNNLTYCNLQVSISHTETTGAAIVFSEAFPMAIDIETIDNNKDDTLLAQLTTNEQKLFFNLSSNTSLQLPLPLLFWTIKEALSKVLKCGLTVPFQLLEIESVIQKGNYFNSLFKNFHQYQAISFLLTEESICSFVFPNKMELDIDILAIQNTMHRFNHIDKNNNVHTFL